MPNFSIARIPVFCFFQIFCFWLCPVVCLTWLESQIAHCDVFVRHVAIMAVDHASQTQQVPGFTPLRDTASCQA